MPLWVRSAAAACKAANIVRLASQAYGFCGLTAAAMLRAQGALLQAALDARLRLQNRFQLTGVIHLDHDVATADELALNVELRKRRPV